MLSGFGVEIRGAVAAGFGDIIGGGEVDELFLADVLADSVGCSGSSLDSVTSGRAPTVLLVGLVAAGSVV